MCIKFVWRHGKLHSRTNYAGLCSHPHGGAASYLVPDFELEADSPIAPSRPTPGFPGRSAGVTAAGLDSNETPTTVRLIHST
jgi:hypothetical protein